VEKIHLLGFMGAALVAGAASGYVAGGANRAPAPKASAQRVQAEDDEDDGLVPIEDGDDAAALKRRVARLEAQLTLLKKGLALAQASGQDTGDGTAPKPIVDGTNPVFELAVRDVMERVQEEGRQDRQDRWRQRSSERVNSTVDTVATKVQLSDSEKDKLREILLDQAEKFMAMRQGGDAGAPRNRDEWRDRMNQIRTDTGAALAQAFGADRANSVSQALEEQRPRFGGPGR
jgi:hypothetical protein